MATLSKLLENCNCANDLIHPNGCLHNGSKIFPRFILSNAKYFLPIVFMPLLLKLKKLNRKKFIDTLEYYAEAIYSGTITGYSIALLICLMRRVYGKFGRYSSFYIPSMLGSFFTFCTATPRVQRLFYTATLQSNIALRIVERKNILTKLLADSLPIQTLSFMGCSAIILHAKRHGKYHGFWFLQPNTRNCKSRHLSTEEEELGQDSFITVNEEINAAQSTFCTHIGQNCYQHLTVGVRLYAAIGFTLDIAKMLISSVPVKFRGFRKVLREKLSNFSLQSTAFLVTYIGIYRFTHCYLNNKTESNQELNHILASFLGGASFLLYPKLALQSLAIVFCLGILWKMFKAYKFQQGFEFLDQLKRLPLPQIVYCFTLAKNIDSYILDPEHVNSLASIIINSITANYAKNIKSNINQKMQSFPK